MKISDENVKSRQYEPMKAYIIGLIAMGHFQMECDKWCMAPSNPNH